MGKPKTIGVITPHKKWFDLYLKNNRDLGDTYIHINSMTKLQGMSFDILILGNDHKLIDEHVRKQADLRLVPKTITLNQKNYEDKI